MSREDIFSIAETNQEKARRVITDSQIVECWQSINATVNLVGSLKTGLLMTHRDIDFHIYTEKLEISQSFQAMTQLAKNPRIIKVEYTNLTDEADACLEWHAWYRDAENEIWQLDMMHIIKGSAYDGYFEKIAERIAAVVTQEQKETILRLKFETPADTKIPGIKYYIAVIRDGVRNYNEFSCWLQNTPLDGIIEWMP